MFLVYCKRHTAILAIISRNQNLIPDNAARIEPVFGV